MAVAPLEDGVEGIAVYDLDGELLDYVGNVPSPNIVKDLVAMVSMIAGAVGGRPTSIEVDLGDKKLVLLIDPPLLRAAIIRKSRR